MLPGFSAPVSSAFSMMYLAMSYDHRVVDGAVADQFLARVKNTLENFDESLL